VIRRLGPDDGETLRRVDRKFKEHVASRVAAEAFVRDDAHVVVMWTWKLV
jgi:hypothetical protein